MLITDVYNNDVIWQVYTDGDIHINLQIVHENDSYTISTPTSSVDHIINYNIHDLGVDAIRLLGWLYSVLEA